MTVFAQMETEHFTFTAIGQDERGALQNLYDAWGKHCDQYHLPDSHINLEDYYGVHFLDFSGDTVAYRDTTILVRK